MKEGDKEHWAEILGLSPKQVEEANQARRQNRKLSRDEEAYLRRQMQALREALLRGDAEHPPLPEKEVASVEELRRYWGVANAYLPEERNDAVSFEVHAIFTQIEDKTLRQELLHSRDDWDERTAQEAVDRLERNRVVDAEARLKAEGRTISPELASVRRTLHELEEKGLARQLPDGRWEAT
jgi:hypothetical protein